MAYLGKGPKRLSGKVYDYKNQVGSSGSVLVSTGSSVNWISEYDVVSLGIETNRNIQFNSLNVSGVSTLGSSNGIGTVIVGVGNTALYIDGNVRVVGILTVGQGTITIDGLNNVINIGVGATITESSISISQIIVDDFIVNGGGSQIGTDIVTRNILASGISTFSDNIDANGNLDVDGYTELDDLNVSGIATITDLNVSGIATITNLNVTNSTFTNLNATNLNVVTGVVTTLSGTNVTYTNSDFINLNANNAFVDVGIVTDISGTRLNYTGVGTIATLDTTNATIDDISNTNLNVSGIATIQNLGVLGDFDVYDTTATFHNNLFIAGNLSIGGTSSIIIAQDLQVLDKEITLGITTNAFNQDVSNDITANHGGIAIASTEGYPLVDLTLAGFSSITPTYKQLMWVAANSYGVGTTDAWMFNYAVGIGSTLVPNDVRLAVGKVQITDTEVVANRFTGTATNLDINGLPLIVDPASNDLIPLYDVTGTIVGKATIQNAALQGTQGTTGIQGTDGTQGIQGTDGTQGIQGTDGTQGIQGTDGTQGIQGTDGTQGIQGTDGTQGIQGIQGTTGTQGIQGIQGTDGTQGTTGTQGIQGATGIQGTTGTQGIQGATGIQGTTGTQGIQGITGTGTQGIQGITGTGTQGIQGIQGPAGGAGGGGESYWTQTSAGIHTLSNVGVGTTNPNAIVTFANISTLSVGVVSSYTVNANVIGVADTSYSNSNNFIVETKTITTATTSQVEIDTFSSDLYRSAKYYAQLTNGSDYHTVEINVLHDGTNVSLLESNDLKLNSACGIFTGSISGSNLILSLTPSSSEPTNIILNRNLVRTTGTAFAPTGDLESQTGTLDLTVGSGQFDLNT